MKQTLMGLLGVILIFSSCQKQMVNSSKDKGFSVPTSGTARFTVLREPASAPCGTPLVTDLVNSSYPPNDEKVFGKLTVSNDAVNLYITVRSLDSVIKIGSIQLLYGDQNTINTGPYSFDGYFGLAEPPINVVVPAGLTTYTVQIPLANINLDCFFLNVHALFIRLDEYGHNIHFPVWTKPLDPTFQVTSFPWTAYVKYCKQSCIITKCGQLRTQTPGGWGAKPAGNNPGTYLYANFQKAFPTGLTVGCATGKTIKLTSASAVTNLLPSGGRAEKLTMSYSNPTGLKNVLVGHLVALTLSVQFDAVNGDFGQAGVTLGAMVISSGAFKGWTVSAFLAEANKVLGGCSSSYTVQQVLDTAAAINENYVGGKCDNRYLKCPTK
jgi:hypothetical protein